MSLIDLVARVATRPMGRVVEAPVRDVVDEVLRQQPVASASDIKALSAEIDRLSEQIRGLEDRLKVLVDAVNEIQQPTSDEDPARLADAAVKAALDSVRAELIDAAVSAAEAAAARVLAGAASTGDSAAEESSEDSSAAEGAVAAAGAAEDSAASEGAGEGAAAEGAAAEGAAEKGGTSPQVIPAAERGCKVPDCERKYRARGFCAMHYQAWRRGTLEGYVSPEGLIHHGQQVLQVADKYIGAPYTITGRGEKLKVIIDDQAVDYTASTP